jgi:hypothetical protein
MNVVVHTHPVPRGICWWPNLALVTVAWRTVAARPGRVHSITRYLVGTETWKTKACRNPIRKFIGWTNLQTKGKGLSGHLLLQGKCLQNAATCLGSARQSGEHKLLRLTRTTMTISDSLRSGTCRKCPWLAIWHVLARLRSARLAHKLINSSRARHLPSLFLVKLAKLVPSTQWRLIWLCASLVHNLLKSVVLGQHQLGWNSATNLSRGTMACSFSWCLVRIYSERKVLLTGS